jgi:hypothetical protein
MFPSFCPGLIRCLVFKIFHLSIFGIIIYFKKLVVSHCQKTLNIKKPCISTKKNMKEEKKEFLQMAEKRMVISTN